ncbi:MAG: phage antirepressor KilAC domain-containing protein [Pseudomonas sp.]|uniref:phage antirepressor KilAC domain-containing protein n=1 Tax=Pseudomonas sp. TaxID=306 RepID=UPI003D13B1A9
MSKVTKIDSQGNTEVVIDGIIIRQDAEGRYCLNDFHKAAGGQNKQRPSIWMQNIAVNALVDQLEAENPASKPVNIRAGRSVAGTYAAKELVYAYAMWISPTYHLKVIRAYDRLATQGVAVHENAAGDLLANPLKYIQALMGQAQTLVDENAKLTEKVGVQAARIAEDKPKADYYSQVRDAKNTQTIGDFAKVLGFGRNKLFAWLRDQNILMHDNMPQQTHINQGHFRVLDKTYKSDAGNKVTYTQTVLTGKGKTYVQKRLKKAGNPDLGDDD